MSASGIPAEDYAASRSRPALGLVGLSIGAMLIILNANVLNVALPTIRQDFGGGPDLALWVINAYALAFAALLLLAGQLGDRLGLRQVFMAGMAVFGVASAACTAATSLEWLVVARTVQGIGAAMLAPGSLALIAWMFEDPGRRARAIGLWAGLSGVAFAAGPVLGGLAVGVFGWRSVFVINIPAVAAALWLVRQHVPVVPRRRRAIDPIGQLLATTGLAALVVGLLETSRYGWTAPFVVVCVAAGAVLLAAFALIQRARERRGRPVLLPSVVVVPPAVRAGLCVAIAYNFGLYGMMLVYSFLLQEQRGLSAFETGLAFLPLTVSGAVTAGIVAGRATARLGTRSVLTVAMLCSAVGSTVLIFTAGHVPYFVIAIGFVLFAGGTGLSLPAMSTAVLDNVPAEHSGLGSGVLNATRQVGGVLGGALLGGLVVGHLTQRTPLAMSITTVCFLLAAAGAARWIPRPRRGRVTVGPASSASQANG